MNKRKILFPSREGNGDYEEIELSVGNPVVFIGKNGAGKTRLSQNIQIKNDVVYKTKNSQSNVAYNNFKSDETYVYRIGAQKNLGFKNYQLKSIYEAELELFLKEGSINRSLESSNYKPHMETNLIEFKSNFEQVIACFFALENLHNANTSDRLEKGESPDLNWKNKRPEKLFIKIWDKLFKGTLKISFDGNDITCERNCAKYQARYMSDGERYILYTIMLLICMPENAIVIVDEPESHVHKSILKDLWDELEMLDKNNIFIYLTHDYDFALSRSGQKLFWIKEYLVDNQNETWKYEELTLDNFSEKEKELLLELMGNPTKYLFIEGERTSLDYFFYQKLFCEYKVIPIGSCSEVKKIIESKDKIENISKSKIYGIIDRDFRTLNEIEKLKEKDIVFFEVAEVENLCLVPELLDYLEDKMAVDKGTSNIAKRKIVELFNCRKNQQIHDQMKSEINHQFQISKIETIPKMDTNDLETAKTIKKLDYDRAIDEILKKVKSEFESNEGMLNEKFEIDNISNFNTPEFSDDKLNEICRNILKIFNDKNIAKEIGYIYNCGDKQGAGVKFQNRIKNYLEKDENSKEIIEILKPYCPNNFS